MDVAEQRARHARSLAGFAVGSVVGTGEIVSIGSTILLRHCESKRGGRIAGCINGTHRFGLGRPNRLDLASAGAALRAHG